MSFIGTSQEGSAESRNHGEGDGYHYPPLDGALQGKFSARDQNVFARDLGNNATTAWETEVHALEIAKGVE
jgi:hypothetical protein